MPAESPARHRNFTPPEIAERFGIATAKVIFWIRAGELKALNLAHRGCRRPRYSVTPESLADFERLREVVPDGALPTIQRLRRKSPAGVKEYF